MAPPAGRSSGQGGVLRSFLSSKRAYRNTPCLVRVHQKVIVQAICRRLQPHLHDVMLLCCDRALGQGHCGNFQNGKTCLGRLLLFFTHSPVKGRVLSSRIQQSAAVCRNKLSGCHWWQHCIVCGAPTLKSQESQSKCYTACHMMTWSWQHQISAERYKYYTRE